MKAISAVIATIMLLMTTVSLIGVFYVFSSTMATQSTSSGSEQASQLTSQLSMCMQIDNILGNQVTLRNCGKGVIENKSLVVTMDDIALGASTQTIAEGNSSIVNVSGLWKIPFGKRNLKISNGAAVAQSLVDVQPKKDGLVGSWNFDEGSGNNAYDGSGNGNIGTLLPLGSEPAWVSGKFGNALAFDGVNDYVDAGNGASLQNSVFTYEAWIKPNNPNSIKTIIGWNTAGPQFRVESTNKIGLIKENTVDIGYSSGIVIANTWNHVAVSYDLFGNYIFYINGVQSGSGTNLQTFVEGNLYIGKQFITELFNGTIDEVRIWNKSFAPDETVAMKRII